MAAEATGIDATPDLYLVGLGVGGFDRRTVEADATLRRCATILHLTEFDHELRAAYDCEVVDLAPVHESLDETPRVSVDLADLVEEHVRERSFLGPVAFVTYGHPLFLVDTGWDLMSRCRTRGIATRALPAPSLIDQSLIDLQTRFDYGFACFDANHFVDAAVTVDPRVPLILSQVGEVGTAVLRQGDLGHRGPFGRLVRRLLEAFPRDRRCALYFGARRPEATPDVMWTTVGELEQLAPFVHVGSNVYVEGSYRW